MNGMAARIPIPPRSLRPGEFVRLVGIFDHCSEFALYHPRQDDHHLYVWVENPHSGELYECAINTRLGDLNRMQVCCLRQPGDPESWPDFGVDYDCRLAYGRELGLSQRDFREVQRGPLADALRGLLPGCSRLQVHGFSYPSGQGLRDVHLNSGEPPSSRRPDRPGQDGALTLYYDARPGVPAYALWVCLKFEPQIL